MAVENLILSLRLKRAKLYLWCWCAWWVASGRPRCSGGYRSACLALADVPYGVNKMSSFACEFEGDLEMPVFLVKG